LAATLRRWLPEQGPGTEEALTLPGALTETTTVNRAALEVLRGLDPEGGDEMVRRVLQLFVESSARTVDRMHEALAARDAQSLAQAAHALKSSAASVGAETLSIGCRALEQLCRDQRGADAAALVESIRTEHERAVRLLGEMLEQMG